MDWFKGKKNTEKKHHIWWWNSMVSYIFSLPPIHWDTHLSPPRVELGAEPGAWLSGQWLLQCPKLQREGPERLGAVDGRLGDIQRCHENPISHRIPNIWILLIFNLVHFGLSVDVEVKMMMFRIFWDALRPNYPLLLFGRSKHGGSQDVAGKNLAIHRNFKGLTTLFVGG